ncbi:hypothetical protein A3L09_03575 [Thermococcus profundus]|uniref:Uncharacterized protein n=1 Tax=Thermococcus profundus TaxID=49899 RepID=A0A2Z2MCT6_THEPR|nr:DUF4389 domain-containing protein [Thermococcus profundus]ASJ02395.1 hypothetical protein A3L09_03575 [Thermococcus profundus]
MGERVEALLRIPLAIMYGFIFYALGIVAGLVLVAQFFYTLIMGRRHEGMARFANHYASFRYHVDRYLLFSTNERPLFDGVGWDEVLPCDFDRKDKRKAYEELKSEFDQVF